MITNLTFTKDFRCFKEEFTIEFALGSISCAAAMLLAAALAL
jgi:hypothetical protein